MKYLLFVAKEILDHDLTVGDFEKAFDNPDKAIEYFNKQHSGWPYEEDCGYEGCWIEVHPRSGQKIHHHGENEYMVIRRPDAMIASWNGSEFKILFRREWWHTENREKYKPGWDYGEDHEKYEEAVKSG